MSKTRITTDEFGRQIGRQIKDAPLTLRQLERLKAARMRAVEAHAHVRAPVGVLAGVGDWFHRHHIEAYQMRRAFACAMLLAIAAVSYWHSLPETPDDDVDAMLLADELPPDAYLSDAADRIAQGS